MADVNISKYRASVVRSGSTPATPGFVVSEGQNPVEPAGSEQNHLPVTINATANALAITTDQVLSGAGTVGQYIRGDGSLADFPSSTGGGSSVSYYLNGSVNQGTIGGVAYKELSKTPILGSGTNFTINANGYIASFLTDAGDPNLLEIPGGNWNFETYFSASSGGGSPTFYVELYKYNGSTFTLIASNSGNPELIAFGTNVTSYFSTLAVPTTALALTDRLAIRYYVTHSGRTITLHTENNHLCQVITTFTTGLTALNGLTAQVQYFAVGTSGTDFNIASATQTHTFNLPTASATNRGALSSSDWSTFNAKQNALTLTTSGSSGASTLVGATLNVPTYTLSGLGGVPTSRQLTINGTAFDLSADRSWSVGTVTSVGLSSVTSGVTIGNTPVTGSGTITLAIATATSTQQGLLSSTDWSTFNNKQNALTLTTTGTSGAATLVGATLNIPQYQAAGTYVTSVTASSPLASSGGTTPNITIQQASGSQSGFLSSTDWTTFNNKQNALTNPVTGTGTTNYLPKFTGSTTIGNSQVFDNGTNVGIGTASPDRKLGILVSPSATGDDGINITNGSTPFILTRTGASYTYRGVAANAGMIYSSSNIALLADGSNITFHNGNGQVASIQSNGNLLVGTTTDNGARLQVSGAATFSSSASFTSSGGSVSISNASDIWYNLTRGSSITNIGIDATGTFYNTNTNHRFLTNSGTLTALTLASTGAATFSSSVTAGGLINTTVGNGLIVGGTGFAYSPSSTRGSVQIVGSSDRILAFGSNGAQDLYIYSSASLSQIVSTPSFSLAVGGLDRLSISSSGNVGIGTSSPIHLLQVANGNLGLYSNSYGNTGLIRMYGTDGLEKYQQGLTTGGDFYQYTFTGLNHIFYTNNGSERMRITSGGNVGIGTSSPEQLLTVAGGSLTVSGNTGLPRQVLELTTASTVSIIKASYQGVGTFGDLSLWTGGTEQMRITSSGNVGIGTTSPSFQLHVNKAGNTGIFLSNTTGNAAGYLYAGGLDGLEIQSVDSSNSTAKKLMLEPYGGNVLIGTTTDNGNKLRVNGVGFFDSGIRTGQPVGTTTNNWLLGRALASGTSTPNRWIRVQIGLEYYDILAVYMGTL